MPAPVDQTLLIYSPSRHDAAAVGALAKELSRVGKPVELHPLAGRGLGDPIMLGRLAVRLRREPPRLLHLRGLPALLAATLAAPRRDAAPWIATVDMRDSLHPWSPRLIQRANDRVARWIAVDEQTRRWLIHSGVAADRIRIVAAPVASATSPVAASRAELLARWNWDAAAPLIVTGTDLVLPARVDDAIWCFELVRVLHPHARILIAGSGPDRARLVRFALQVGDPGCVVFDAGDDALAAALRCAKAYWQLGPAATVEPALVQAMRAGLPIVASDVPPHAEALGAGGARLVPLGERAAAARATDALFRDEAVCKTLGEAATLASKRFDLDNIAAAYAEAFAAASVVSEIAG